MTADAAGGARRVAVIVPARDERGSIGACLASLARQQLPAGWCLEVTVVCGDCGDGTADVARRWIGAGRPLRGRIVDMAESGKAVALDAGDAAAGVHRGDAQVATVPRLVAYLDADVVLAPGAVAAWVEAAERGARLVCCRPAVRRPRTWLARAYVRTWLALPSVVDDAAGAGCFVVSDEGRGRWSGFPRDLPDDAFVRSLFAPSECRVVAIEAVVRFPEAGELVGVVARWRDGNRHLRSRGGMGSRRPRWLTALAVATDVRALSGLPVFVLVNAAARHHRSAGWARAR